MSCSRRASGGSGPSRARTHPWPVSALLVFLVASLLLGTMPAYAAGTVVSPQSVTYTSTPNDPDFLSTEEGVIGGYLFPHYRSWWLRGNYSTNANLVWPNLRSAETTPYGARADAERFKVAVIGSGYWMAHPDKGDVVVGKDMCESFSFATGSVVATTDYDVTPVDPDTTCFVGNHGPERIGEASVSHGTAVAGVINAAPNNGIGMVGVGYDAKVVVYKVQGKWVEGDPDWGQPAGTPMIPSSVVAAAIRQAADDGCSVIDVAVSDDPDQTPDLVACAVRSMVDFHADDRQRLQDAVAYARSKGSVVVAGAGMSVQDWDGAMVSIPTYPSALDGVVGVSLYGLDPRNPIVHRTVANYTDTVDALAPGSWVWTHEMPGFTGSGQTWGINWETHYPFAEGYLAYGGPAWGSSDGYSALRTDTTALAAGIYAGSVAMLWRFMPDLTGDEVVQYLNESAWPIDGTARGTRSPLYGYGRVDVNAAYERMKADYPELSKPTVTVTGDTTRTASWTAVTGHDVSYLVSVDGGPSVETTSTSFELPVLPDGYHTVKVTAKSPRNWWSDSRSSTTATFPVGVVPPPAVATSLTVQASAATVAYGGAVTLSGYLKAGGSAADSETVTLYRSYDGGANWSVVGTMTTDATGKWSKALKPGRTTLYQARFSGDAEHLMSASGSVRVSQRVYLTRPYGKSTIARYTRYSYYGYLKPRHTSGAKNVRVYAYKWNSSKRKYVYCKSFAATNSNYSSYTKYKTTVSLPSGKYRLVGVYAATSKYAKTASAPTYVTSK